MTTETQAEFGRRLGVSKSYINKLKNAGRLVMEDDRVNVEASQARIATTADPQRDDVAARHAANRAAPSAPAAPAHDPVGNSYQAARAVKEKYAALQAKADYEKSIGDLIPRADVDFVLNDYGATLRGLLENLADRLAPVIHPLQTLEETHAALAEAAEAVLWEISETMAARAGKREASHV